MRYRARPILLFAILASVAAMLVALISTEHPGVDSRTVRRNDGLAHRTTGVARLEIAAEPNSREAIVEGAHGDRRALEAKSLADDEFTLRVRSAGSGRAIPGTRVIAMTQDPIGFTEQILGASGEMVAPVNAGASYSISAPGHEPREVPPSSDPEGEVMEIRLAQYVRLEGQVVGNTGRISILVDEPVDGADEPETRKLGEAWVLDDGAWVKDNVIVPFGARALENVRVEVEVRGEKRVLAEGLRLTHGDSIFIADPWVGATAHTLQLRYEDGAPLGPGLLARLSRDGLQVSGRTDSGGDVAFSALPRGTWTCELFMPGGVDPYALGAAGRRPALATQMKFLADHGTATFLEVRGLHRVSGTLKGADGSALPGNVALVGAGYSQRQHAKGEFRFDLVPTGGALALEWIPDHPALLEPLEREVLAGDAPLELRPKRSARSRLSHRDHADDEFFLRGPDDSKRR